MQCLSESGGGSNLFLVSVRVAIATGASFSSRSPPLARAFLPFPSPFQGLSRRLGVWGTGSAFEEPRFQFLTYLLFCSFLVSKETVVLRRWGRSKQKFGFIKRVDKG